MNRKRQSKTKGIAERTRKTTKHYGIIQLQDK